MLAPPAIGSRKRGRGYKYLTEQQCRLNRARSRIRAKAEHAIGAFKRIFGFNNVRYCRITKNTNRPLVACALANLFMVGHRLLRLQRA